MDKDLAALHAKVDQLTEQVSYLTVQARDQQRRSQEFDELKADLIPIGNQLVNLTIQELQEIGSEFELEDLLYLLKRALRNTHLILSMMDRLEALMGALDEVELLGKQVFAAAVEALDRWEQTGLFQQTGELLTTLSEGNVLVDLNRVLKALDASPEGEESPPSLFSVLGKLNQPEVRRGLSRLLAALNALGAPAGDMN